MLCYNVNMNDLSLEDRQTPNRVSLPPIAQFIATAERGEDARVARPGDYPAPSAAHALQYGQPPQQGPGYTQAFTPYHQSHGQINNSVESVPSTAYYSPRMMTNNHHLDTSSLSPSSRESSVYSATPSSVTVTPGTARIPRTTRTKRGSESQGSNSGRRSKRTSTSMGNHQSGDEVPSWCDACNCHSDRCSSPKEHTRKSKKIDKEKAARNDMAELMQEGEDLVELIFDLTCLKLQMPGNQKKSGLTWDKQQDMESILVVLNKAMSKLASLLDPEDFEAFTEDVNRTIAYRVAAKGGGERGSYAGDLLGSPSGDESCLHERRGQRCEFPIACRKTRRARNYSHNMDRTRESHTITITTPTPTPTSAASDIAIRTARANL